MFTLVIAAIATLFLAAATQMVAAARTKPELPQPSSDDEDFYPATFTPEALQKGIELLHLARKMKPGQHSFRNFDSWLVFTGHVPAKQTDMIHKLRKDLLPVVLNEKSIAESVKKEKLEKATAYLGKCRLKAEADRRSR